MENRAVNSATHLRPVGGGNYSLHRAIFHTFPVCLAS
jgi:hypothetical protein